MGIARTFAVVLFASSFAAGAADSGKVLRTAFSIAESSFDPVLAWDAASDAVIEHIEEPMLDYEYLARPVKLAPRTVERLPEVSDNGATYLCRVRKGRLRLLAQAPARSGAALAVDMARRGQAHRRRRAAGRGEEERQARLRCACRGTRGRRSVHAAHPSETTRLHVPVRSGDAGDGRGRARSHRGLRH